MTQYAFICDAVRTPIGRYAGALAPVRTDDLAAAPISALMARHLELDWGRLDDVVLGCANQAGEDNRNVARMAALLAGLPIEVGGATVNRLCGSGLEAVAAAARAVHAGDGEFYVAGGVESMSRSPFVMPKSEEGFSRRAEIADTTIGWRFVNPKMKDKYGVDPLGITAENVAEEHQISRAAQDAMAFRSQQRAARAQKEGRLAEEIIPLTVSRGKKTTQVTVDEHPRPDTTLEQLEQLKPAFRPGGTVTAGNSSGVNDGAAAVIVASERMASKLGLTIRARVVGVASAGVAPREMGIGPVPATRKLAARLQIDLKKIDVIELNEAFAAQGVAVLRSLGLPEDGEHINPNGGAIALGHPLGMSGARLIATATRELERRKAKQALCTMCVGVGQGVSAIIERV
jgi:acetyl-CoA acyltransferase